MAKVHIVSISYTPSESSVRSHCAQSGNRARPATPRPALCFPSIAVRPTGRLPCALADHALDRRWTPNAVWRLHPQHVHFPSRSNHTLPFGKMMVRSVGHALLQVRAISPSSSMEAEPAAMNVK